MESIQLLLPLQHPDVGGGIGTNELPGVLTWFIFELRLCTKDWSTTGFTSLSRPQIRNNNSGTNGKQH